MPSLTISSVGALAQQARLDEALAETNRAVELDPLSSEILWDMNFTLAWQGKYQVAREQSRRAADLDPAFFLHHYTAAWIDIEAGQIGDAIPELRKDALKTPPFVAAWLGYAYWASG